MRAIIQLKHGALSVSTWDNVTLVRDFSETANVAWSTWEKIRKSGDPIELVREIYEEDDPIDIVPEKPTEEPAPNEEVKDFPATVDFSEPEPKPKPKKKPKKRAKSKRK